MRTTIQLIGFSAAAALGCRGDGDSSSSTHDPDAASDVTIDRFSDAAGTLMIRNDQNGLPVAGAAIDFDQSPFITRGLGPDGTSVQYYNFDNQSTMPASIYVLFREGEADPVADQLNIVDAVPGDDGYNDFWRVNAVTVPADYVANTVASYEEIQNAGYPIRATDTLVNCPIVPDGSTATLRGGSENAGLHTGWYREQLVYYFSFEEAALAVEGTAVPLSNIYVTFNSNEDGPASGFVTEIGTDQTHNVVATLPEDAGYSPLWYVAVYDNADFDDVMDLATAMSANILAEGVATVNCPIVSSGE